MNEWKLGVKRSQIKGLVRGMGYFAQEWVEIFSGAYVYVCPYCMTPSAIL